MTSGLTAQVTTTTTTVGAAPGGTADDDGGGAGGVMVVIVLLGAGIAFGLSAVAQRLRRDRPAERPGS